MLNQYLAQSATVPNYNLTDVLALSVLMTIYFLSLSHINRRINNLFGLYSFLHQNQRATVPSRRINQHSLFCLFTHPFSEAMRNLSHWNTEDCLVTKRDCYGFTALSVWWESVAPVNSAACRPTCIAKTLHKVWKKDKTKPTSAPALSHKLKVQLQTSLTWLWSSACPQGLLRECVWLIRMWV